MLELLPVSQKETIQFEHFPTKAHAVVFRLWNMVPVERIACVLSTDKDNILKIADRMGLGKEECNAQWMEKGYITIIKALWHLMPYEQIIEILGWSEERLAYILKEDDFLGVKLGRSKPKCERVIFREFSQAERAREAEIAKIMKPLVEISENTPEKSEPFDFFNLPYKSITQKKINEVELNSEWSFQVLCDNTDIKIYIEDFKDFARENFDVKFKENSEKKITVDISPLMKNEEDHKIIIEDEFIKIVGASPLGIMRALYFMMSLAERDRTLTFEKKCYIRKTKIKSRIIYSFCGLYGDVLDKDNLISFPDELLKGYAKRGINGVWIQAVVYKLIPFKYDESLSKGWEKRIENLRNLIKRAGRYGIKVYLYINEPRSMPPSFFKKYPHIKGHDNSDLQVAMCTSTEEVKKYVHDAFSFLASMVPGLGGFWNICMSENLTHCYSRKTENMTCPRCKDRKPYEVAAEITSIMINAVHSVDENMKFFVYSWAFERFFNDEELKCFIKSIPKSAVIVSVSENNMPVEFGGVKGNVSDYSMSCIGPGEWAKKIWKMSRDTGVEVGAKIQINTTWECSTAPFLPVYENVLSHLENLRKENIEHLFLSWTLGGYISDNLKIASNYFFYDENSESEDIYAETLKNEYGDYYENVMKAVHWFCKGFCEYPFDIEHIYFGPSNLGTANLFFEKGTGEKATMTAFPYDDVKGWSSIYNEDILLNQYTKICDFWERGLREIKNMPLCEFKDMAFYGYSLFKSSLNQLKYYKLRNTGGSRIEMTKIIEKERILSEEVYKMLVRNCCIGYEAANHYYVCKTMIAEKLLQCEYLLKKKNSNSKELLI